MYFSLFVSSRSEYTGHDGNMFGGLFPLLANSGYRPMRESRSSNIVYLLQVNVGFRVILYGCSFSNIGTRLH